MTALTAKKLVVKRKEGTFVSEHVNECLIDPLNIMIHMEVGEIKDLMQIREILELGTIRLAAEKADEETILNMERLDWQMNEPGITPEVMQKRDIEFHSEIAKASGNPVLMELLKALRKVIATNVESQDVMFALGETSHNMHREIIEAIRKHDAETAYRQMKKYFQYVNENGAFKK